MADVAEQCADVDGQPVRWFEAPVPGGGAPVLYVHGVPTSGRLWRAFLERTGGLAPDLPGFGRSGKRADLPFDVPFYAAWIERFLAARGVERVRLVAHDWGGALALAWAQEHPDRVERLVVLDAIPLLPGYRWHRVARAWRTPVLGELVVGAMTPWVLRRTLGRAGGAAAPLPPEFTELVLEGWDQGTQRAVLRLYRSAPPDALARAGGRLGDLRCPALAVWGARDAFVPPDFAEAYAAALGGDARARVFEDAGHWVWYDRPEVVDEVARFALA